jgi:hypothetical protein
VHFLPVVGADGSSVEIADFEGVLDGKVAGHYLLLTPKLLQGADATYSLDQAVEIPVGRVWFMERLAS